MITSAGNGSGNVASGAVDSGNPIKIGAKFNLTPVALDDQDRGDVQVDQYGNVLMNMRLLSAVSDKVAVTTVGSDTVATQAQVQDGFGNAVHGVSLSTGTWLLGVSTTEGAVYLNWNPLVLALGTTSFGSAITRNARELLILVTITGITGTATPGLQFVYELQDGNGVWVPIWASSVFTSTGPQFLCLGPGLANNLSVGMVGRLQAIVTGSSAPTVTITGTVWFRT